MTKKGKDKWQGSKPVAALATRVCVVPGQLPLPERQGASQTAKLQHELSITHAQGSTSGLGTSRTTVQGQAQWDSHGQAQTLCAAHSLASGSLPCTAVPWELPLFSEQWARCC